MITSKQNPAIKMLVNLRRRRDRADAGVTLVDGFEELSCALASNVPIKTLYYCTELMAGEEQRLTLQRLLASGIEAVELSRSVFEKAAYREGPDGWLAVVSAPTARLADLHLGPNPLLLVCEAIEKPGNLGAMLRTADAAGVDAVISVAGVTDWGNPNVIRASKGAVFAVPVADAQPQEALDWLRANNITVVASTPDTAVLYTQSNLSQGVALTVGSEKYGHSKLWLDAASIKVRIPMVGKVNSLNAATSAALLVYEAVRQRATS